MISDLFSLENQVGAYEGPRLGNPSVGGPDDFVYSAGYSGLLKDRAGIEREGAVYQLGGFRSRSRSQRRKQKKQIKRKRSTRRRLH
jgi:hypothetical protein